MTPTRWRQIRDLLDQAVEQLPSEREEFLLQACGDDASLRREVVSLLRSYDAASNSRFMDTPAVRLPAPAVSTAATDEPVFIGRYRLQRLLGHGGMGVVYLARRDDDTYHQEVAIKLLQGGLIGSNMVQRFRSERQILAQLRHPHIARLIDGGNTEQGQPYLVMDYVDGTPIDRYCDEHRLSIADRLAVLRKVCLAVHFAHQNLVIHRDLKPGNILVGDDGEPTLLDFGLAKLLVPDNFPLSVTVTRDGFRAMTPQYASPEQVRGQSVTTASDVYSLGVLLYELLTGHRPYELNNLTMREVLLRVCEEQPARPSIVVQRPRQLFQADGSSTTLTPRQLSAARGSDPRALGRRLAGDLDNIVLRALAKDPARRYPSAEQLALDIDRYLAGLPVLARKDTLLYRTGKLVARHKWATAGLAVALVFLIGFVVALLVQRGQILAQRNQARWVSGFLVDTFEIADPNRARGEAVTAREILDGAARRIERQPPGSPEVRAELITTMGRSYRNLGLYEEAETLLRRALELRMQLFGDKHPVVAASRHELGELLGLRGDYDEGGALLEAALKTRRSLSPVPRAEIAESLYRLAQMRQGRGDLPGAAKLFEQALYLAREIDRPELLARVLDRFAILTTRQAEYDSAEAMFAEALEIYEGSYGSLHPEVALTHNNLAALLDARGEYARAEERYRVALATQRQLFAGPHPHIATTLLNLAHLAKRRGRFDQAKPLYDEALAMGRQVYGPAHPKLASALLGLGDLAYEKGRIVDAEKLYEEASSMRRAVLGSRHPDTATSLDRLAQVLVDTGEHARAGAMYREALEISRESLGPRHPQVAARLANLADLAFERRQFEEAERLYREALSIQRESLAEDHPDVVITLFNLASLLEARGNLDAADLAFGEALSLGRRSLGAEHVRIGMIMTSWASLKHALGNDAEATSLAESGLLILTAALSEDHPWAQSARRILERSSRSQRP